MRSIRHLRFAGCLPLLVFLAACGSSSTTVTSPASAERCSITLNTGSTSVPASGGNGTVGVTATRECAWSATVEGGWLTIRSGASGQGEGAVEFAAAPNADPQVRAGAIVVNGSRAQITQGAGECVITLAASSANISPIGGTAQIEVRASSALCTWNASPDTPWITIASAGPGRGNGTVTIAVAATTGPPRIGSVTIAGQEFSVIQAQGCAYAIAPASQAISSAGGSGQLAVTTTPACPWTASSNADWMTVTPSEGSGPGVVAFTVAATQGPERTGSAVVAGQLFTVTQSPGCVYDVEPLLHTVPAAGGGGAVTIVTSAGCGWAASSNVPWITIQGAATGAGPGQFTFLATATTGAARSGSLSVAGRTVTVTQTQGCTFAISPQSQTVPSSGGSGRVTVTAGAGCAWTASSAAPWATITSGASGSGNGEVQFSAAATTGPGRSTTLTIAGQAFALTQGQGCTTTLSPSRVDVDDDGGQRSFDVQTAAGCGWSASTTTPWLTITSGASGSGNGTVRFTVAPNSGPGRSGSITAGGQTFTVTQGTGCSVTLSSDRHDLAAAGGNGSVNVLAGAGCGWTATSNTPEWLTVTAGANGSGNGAVNFTATANPGPPRQGSLTIGGQVFTVNQAGGCSYAISPATASVGAAGGDFEVDVTAGGGCSWTSESRVEWIAVTMGATGNNNGKVRLAVQANPGAERTGTVAIAGHTFTLTQASGCSFTVSPEAINGVAAAGEARRIDVTTASNCAWTATSSDAWITVPQNAGGSGTGAVDVAITANTAADARTGIVTVAGRQVTISQQGAAPPPCVITLTPSSQTISLAGGTGSVAVSATAGCLWTASSPDAWITITAGASGNGNGVVEFSVAASATPRTGTLVVNGQTFTITQQ